MSMMRFLVMAGSDCGEVGGTIAEAIAVCENRLEKVLDSKRGGLVQSASFAARRFGKSESSKTKKWTGNRKNGRMKSFDELRQVARTISSSIRELDKITEVDKLKPR